MSVLCRSKQCPHCADEWVSIVCMDNGNDTWWQGCKVLQGMQLKLKLDHQPVSQYPSIGSLAGHRRVTSRQIQFVTTSFVCFPIAAEFIHAASLLICKNKWSSRSARRTHTSTLQRTQKQHHKASAKSVDVRSNFPCPAMCLELPPQ